VKLLIALLFLVSSASVFAQSTDQLSPDEVKAAIAAKPNSGFVSIMDMTFGVASACEAQMPMEDIFTPAGWVNARSANARRQFLPFNPAPDETSRVLRVISYGCANGTPSGPVCDSITRAVLLSDKEGTAKAESISDTPRPATWHNGYGTTASCSSLVSEFTMADVQRVRNAKGEFLIATFNGATLLKIYTVKQRFIKQLGL
jgi:hypothetical protein